MKPDVLFDTNKKACVLLINVISDQVEKFSCYLNQSPCDWFTDTSSWGSASGDHHGVPEANNKSHITCIIILLSSVSNPLILIDVIYVLPTLN